MRLYGKQRHLDGTLQRERIVLHRDAHVAYLLSGLGQLSGAYSSLDASRPWLCYWIVHSLELIAPGSVPAELADQVAGFLSRCQDGAGGLRARAGAAPRRRAAVRPRHARHRARIRVPRPRQTALVPTADEDCRRRLPHARGWGVRCARLVHGAGGRITRQRARRRAGGGSRRVDRVVPDARGRDRRDAWRGGSRRVHLLRARRPSASAVDRLRCRSSPWLAQRQMGAEGGFQGRTNKLVDGCYSFWQGGSFPLLHAAIQRHRSGGEGRSDNAAAAGAPPFFNAALLDYVMVCCQVPHGGSATSPAARATTTPATASPASRSASPLRSRGGGGGEVPDE